MLHFLSKTGQVKLDGLKTNFGKKPDDQISNKQRECLRESDVGGLGTLFGG
jgi:hypothetical protein